MDLFARTPRRDALRTVAARAAAPSARLARTALADTVRTARAAAFWVGVCLPCLHVPLLLAAGFTETTAPLLVALWTLQACSLAVGAGHDPQV